MKIRILLGQDNKRDRREIDTNKIKGLKSESLLGVTLKPLKGESSQDTRRN